MRRRSGVLTLQRRLRQAQTAPPAPLEPVPGGAARASTAWRRSSQYDMLTNLDPCPGGLAWTLKLLQARQLPVEPSVLSPVT